MLLAVLIFTLSTGAIKCLIARAPSHNGIDISLLVTQHPCVPEDTQHQVYSSCQSAFSCRLLIIVVCSSGVCVRAPA